MDCIKLPIGNTLHNASTCSAPAARLRIKRSVSSVVTTFVLIVVLAPAVYADCGPRGCTAKITRLYVRAATGLVSIGTDGIEEDIGNCQPSEGVYIDLDPGQAGYESVYKILLTAMLADRAVFIRTVGTPSNAGKCKVAYVTLDK